MKPALLVLDLQKAFLSEGAAADSLEAARGPINAVAAAFREKGLPVAAVYHVSAAAGAVPGAEGFEFVEGIELGKDDRRVRKEYGNAFNKTGLGAWLAERGVDTVFVAGYCAEHCVLSTYRGARDLDLLPVLVRECLVSDDPRGIEFVERISETITPGILLRAIGAR